MTFLSEFWLLFLNLKESPNLTFFLNIFLYNSELNLVEGFFFSKCWLLCSILISEWLLFFYLRILCVISESWLFLEFWLYSKQSDFLLVFDFLSQNSAFNLRIPTFFICDFSQNSYFNSSRSVVAVLLHWSSVFGAIMIQRGYYHNVLRPRHTHLRPKNAYRRRPDFYVSYVACIGYAARYAARLRTHRKYFSRRVAITVLTSRQR